MKIGIKEIMPGLMINMINGMMVSNINQLKMTLMEHIILLKDKHNIYLDKLLIQLCNKKLKQSMIIYGKHTQ
jgi:hypothetical protein